MPSERASFHEQVIAQIERLRNKDLKTIEAEVIAKRTLWIDSLAADERPDPRASVSPRTAFEMLFFR